MEETRRTFNWKEFVINNNTFIILLLLIVVSTFMSDTFLTTMNIRNIMLQQAGPILVAMGLLFVILTGGIDLSVGSIMALGATVSAILITDMGLHFTASIGTAVLVGLALGLFSGVLVAYAGMQGFVATLATMTIARGVAFVITEGRPVKIEADTISTLVSQDYMYPIIWITILLIFVFMIIHRYTGYGRKVIAIGSNETALKLAGVRTKRYVMSTYALSGALAALAGVFVAARSSTGSATVGMGQELDAIAAVVIGGASLMGGRGFVLNTVAGALILGLIGNIMNLMAVPSYPQDIIKGAIIVAAVLLQIVTSKKDRTI
ncbi:ABC transporter permease [Kroppenstedtia eburnea]|uniref:Monosaccharide ABC transporter membrane protein, CUT2 family n=1 Tax=Kroppenstedtia eburnea TaxID=714067 RepID=A0A1N7MGE8_9BACL|nr:ABC transporter permease [Kroppenstedtia eburnea]QKI81552.1 ABC transporter permease [Kroppenstedtia eburnea]SIS85061.1 monosaccharide ABC transporter membrane protein, CUT2 family [Kroppenstedtia eburnea]